MTGRSAGTCQPDADGPATIGAADAFCAVLLAVMLTVPFLLPYARPPFSSFYQEWIAVAAGLAAFSVCAFSKLSAGFRLPRPALAVLALAALIVLHAALGRTAYWQQGALAALYLLWAAALAVMGDGLRRAWGWDRFAAVCAAALAAGALLAAAVALAQLAGWFPTGWVMRLKDPRLYGNLGQANHFASYLFVGLVSVVWLASTGRLAMSVGILLALPVLVGLAFSGSRSVWLYFLTAIALAAWFAQRSRDRQMRRAVFGLVAALAVCMLLSLPWSSIGAAQTAGTETALQRIGIGATGIRERLQAWLAALAIFREAPFLGAGFGQYAWQYFLLTERLPQLANSGLNDNAHNLFFHVLAELGTVGALLVAAGVALWLLDQRYQPRTPARWWMLSILAVLGVHSLLEYPLWYAYFLGLFSLLVGAGSTGRLELPVRRRLAVPAMIGAAWLVLLLLGWDYRRIELLAGRPVAELTSEVVALHRGSLLSHVVELGIVSSMPLDRQRAAAQRALSARVLRWIPAGDLAFKHAILLALDGDARAAEDFWKRAALAYPSQESEALALLRAMRTVQSDALDELLEYAASRGVES